MNEEKGEETQEQVEEQEEEPTSETPETPEEKPKPSNELKVVIVLKEDKIMLGVQSPDCDPVYTTLTGTLAAALKRVPKLVDEAKEKWSATPRNPAANLPTPEPPPARTPAAPKEKAQPSFF
ncbi:hypothetical protein ES708_05948 [subsurface metagenome]